jgi:hypothetical protein
MNKPAKPYITGQDRLVVKIRNPQDGRFTSKSFKFSDYDNDRSKAEAASKEWSVEIQKMIDEKNSLLPQVPKVRKQRSPKIKLQIEGLKEAVGQTQVEQPTIQQPTIQQPTIQQQVQPAPTLQQKPFPFTKWISEKTGSSLVIMGKSKSGKTSFLSKIVKNLPKDIIKIVISPNIHNEIYTSMKHRCVYSPEFNVDLIKLCQRINQKTKNHYRFCIILDDLIEEKSNTMILKMFLTLRNSNISVILSIQSTMLINKLIRGNANYILLGKLSGEESILDTTKKFLINYKDELNIKSDRDTIPVYDSLTKDYNFIFVNSLKEKIYQTNNKLLR